MRNKIEGKGNSLSLRCDVQRNKKIESIMETGPQTSTLELKFLKGIWVSKEGWGDLKVTYVFCHFGGDEGASTFHTKSIRVNYVTSLLSANNNSISGMVKSFCLYHYNLQYSGLLN